MRLSTSQFIAAMNEPTPGSTSLRAAAMMDGSRDRCRSAPDARNARAMLATFATGESMRIVSILAVILGVSEGSVWASGTLTAPPAHTGPSLTLGMTSLDHSFRARYVAAHDLLRLAQRDGEGLENCLRGVMSVAAADQIDVDVARALVGERLEELLDQ